MATLRRDRPNKKEFSREDGDYLLTITLEDDYSDAVRNAINRIDDLSPIYKLWGEQMLLSIDENYVKEMDPYGVPWKPNSPYTIAQKKALGRINKILQSSGLLRQSYAYKKDSSGVKIGTNDPKAAKHQFGIGVAKRVHLGVSKQDLIDLKKTLVAYVVDGNTTQPPSR